MRTQRQLRVGEELRHALASVLLRGDVPWPQGLNPPTVTVSEVKVSPDLTNATVYVMPLGGVLLKETVKAMNASAGFYRYAIGKAVKLRHVPQLRFFADETFAVSQRIEEILLAPAVAKDLHKQNEAEED